MKGSDVGRGQRGKGPNLTDVIPEGSIVKTLAGGFAAEDGRDAPERDQGCFLAGQRGALSHT